MTDDDPKGPSGGFSLLDAIQQVANQSINETAERTLRLSREVAAVSLEQQAREIKEQLGLRPDLPNTEGEVREELSLVKNQIEGIRKQLRFLDELYEQAVSTAKTMLEERNREVEDLEAQKRRLEQELQVAEEEKGKLETRLHELEEENNRIDGERIAAEVRAGAAEAQAKAQQERADDFERRAEELAKKLDNVVQFPGGKKPPEEKAPPAEPQPQAAGPTPEPHPKTTAAPPLGGVGREDDMTGTHVPPQGHGPAETPAQSTWHDRVRDGARDLGRKAVMGLAILGVLFASYLLFRSFGYNSRDTVETRMANGGSVSAPRPPANVPAEKKAEPAAPAAADDEGLRTVITRLRNQVVSLQAQLTTAVTEKGTAEVAKAKAEAELLGLRADLKALNTKVDEIVNQRLVRELGMYLKDRFQFIVGRCKDEKSLDRLFAHDVRRWGGENPEFHGMVNEVCRGAPEERRTSPVVAGRGNEEDVDPPSPNSFGNEGRAPTRQRVHFGPAQRADCPGRFDASARACRQ